MTSYTLPWMISQQLFSDMWLLHSSRAKVFLVEVATCSNAILAATVVGAKEAAAIQN